MGIPFPLPGAEPSCCATPFISFFALTWTTISRLAPGRAWVLPRAPSLQKHQHLLQCLPGRAASAWEYSCAAPAPCVQATVQQPNPGRAGKNLQKAEIERASLLVSVLSKESENKGTKANTDYSNNLFNSLLLPDKDPRHQPKKAERQREMLCLCCERAPHCCPRSTAWAAPRATPRPAHGSQG